MDDVLRVDPDVRFVARPAKLEPDQSAAPIARYNHLRPVPAGVAVNALRLPAAWNLDAGRESRCVAVPLLRHADLRIVGDKLPLAVEGDPIPVHRRRS